MLPVVADEKVGALTAVSMVALPDELLDHVVRQTYYSPLQPRLLVYLSSASRGLGASMQALLRQLKADHAAATALCSKMGLRSCKELREGKDILSHSRGLSAADLATLGKQGSALPTLETLLLIESSAGAAGPDGAQRLAEGLGAGALPAVTILTIDGVCMWATQAPRSSPPLWTEAPCRGSRSLLCVPPPSATMGLWPSRRPCGRRRILSFFFFLRHAESYCGVTKHYILAHGRHFLTGP